MSKIIIKTDDYLDQKFAQLWSKTNNTESDWTIFMKQIDHTITEVVYLYDHNMGTTTLTFATDEDKTLFLLRWS